VIFLVTWSEVIGGEEQTIRWFCVAESKQEARQLARTKQLAKNHIVVEEWVHCMAPQHADIPTVPNLDRHTRQIERAVAVHEGQPYCARCLEHACSDLGARVERLERAFCELLDSFNLHTDNGHP